jgi:hypothetical protein
MASPTVARLALLWVLAVTAGAAPPKPEAVKLRGKVVELSAALRSLGLPSDTEPVSQQVVLQRPDGSITPLLADEASRALFLDSRLRDRLAELQARRYAGLPYVQVVAFQVEDQGTLRTPEYFCEVCTITVRYPQTCPCCQGAMVLKMQPPSSR